MPRRVAATLRSVRLLAFACACACAGTAGCKKSVGELKTVDVVADAQGAPAQPANVSVAVQTGELHVTPGGAHTVGGAVRSNVVDLDPKIEAAADHVKVTQGEGANDTKWSGTVVADWRLTLGPTAMVLAIDTGAASADLELGGLALKSLGVHATTGAVRVAFASANPLAADTIDVGTGTGTITMTDVARFGAGTIKVRSTSGAIAVTLGARLDRDVVLDVASDSGPVRIGVPASTTARADVKGGAVTPAGWSKDGDAFVLGAAGAAARVTVHVKTSGAVTLEAS